MHVPTHCNWFGSSVFASDSDNPVSLHHKRNVSDGVVSGIGTLFSADHKLDASDYDPDSVASENQPSDMIGRWYSGRSPKQSQKSLRWNILLQVSGLGDWGIQVCDPCASFPSRDLLSIITCNPIEGCAKSAIFETKRKKARELTARRSSLSHLIFVVGANAWVEIMDSVSWPEVSAHLSTKHGSVAVTVPITTQKNGGVGCNTYIQDKPSFSV